jgi:23S rRNA (adenine-N6)-dimethyltransferase
VAVRPRSQRGSGQHFLRSSKLAAELVRAAGIERGDLVLDVGAGTGVLTAPLARCCDRVVAVEIDPALGEALRRRLPAVDVLIADAARVPLPREPFKVVANLPFGGATAILRRLLDPSVPLQTADVIVEWAVAAKRAAVWPSTRLGAYWGAWFELSVARRLPRCVFAPTPSVDAAVLRVARRVDPFVSVADRRRYDRFLTVGFRDGLRSVVPSRELKRYEAELGLDRRAHARDLDARQWATLFLAAVRRAR